MKKVLFLFIAILCAGFLPGAENWFFDFAKDLPPKSIPNFPFGGLTRSEDHIEIPSWGYIVNWGFAGVLEPDREYRMTIRGNGPCDIYITFGEGKSLQWRINLDGTYERVFRAPVYLRKTGFLRICRPKGAKDPLILRDVRFQALPDAPGCIRLKRDRLTALPLPGGKQLRGVALHPGDAPERADIFRKMGANLIRIRFTTGKQLNEALTALPSLRRNHCAVTLEYVPANASEFKAEVLLKRWKEFFPAIKPFRDEIAALSPASGIGGPAWREEARKVVREFNRQLPGVWLIYQPGSNAELADNLWQINAEKLIYAVRAESENDLQVLRSFASVTGVKLLIDTAPEFVSRFDDYGFSWSADRDRNPKDYARPMHRNGSADQQRESLYSAWSQQKSDSSLNLIFATDTHYLAGNGNYNYSLDHMKQMARIASELKLDLISNGGDVISGREKNKTETVKELAAMADAVFSSGIRPAIVIGNHDNNVAFSGKKDVIEDRLWHKICAKKSFEYGAVGDENNPDANYYYYEFPTQKIRVVVLAILENPMKFYSDGKLNFGINSYDISVPQLNWLSRKALNFMDKTDRSEWAVVFLTHSVPDRDYPNNALFQGVLKAFQNGAAYFGESRRGLWPGSVNADFVRQGAGKVLCMIHGHFHRDMLSYPNGFAQIGFRCCYGKEPSLALIAIDRKNNEMRVLRYGHGDDFVVPLNN